MIVRIEVTTVSQSSNPYWQLLRCHVQRVGVMEDGSDPQYLRPIRFDSLEEAIRHAKKATFTHLEAAKRPRVVDQSGFPCAKTTGQGIAESHTQKEHLYRIPPDERFNLVLHGGEALALNIERPEDSNPSLTALPTALNLPSGGSASVSRSAA